jgi:hypothetical protein
MTSSNLAIHITFSHPHISAHTYTPHSSAHFLTTHYSFRNHNITKLVFCIQQMIYAQKNKTHSHAAKLKSILPEINL